MRIWQKSGKDRAKNLAKSETVGQKSCKIWQRSGKIRQNLAKSCKSLANGSGLKIWSVSAGAWMGINSCSSNYKKECELQELSARIGDPEGGIGSWRPRSREIKPSVYIV